MYIFSLGHVVCRLRWWRRRKTGPRTVGAAMEHVRWTHERSGPGSRMVLLGTHDQGNKQHNLTLKLPLLFYYSFKTLRL